MALDGIDINTGESCIAGDFNACANADPSALGLSTGMEMGDPGATQTAEAAMTPRELPGAGRPVPSGSGRPVPLS